MLRIPHSTTTPTYTINNPPSGVAISWSVSPSGISVQTSGNDAILTGNTAGEYTLTATISINGNTIPLTKQIVYSQLPSVMYSSYNNLVLYSPTVFGVLTDNGNVQYAGSLTVSKGAGTSVQWSKISGPLLGFDWRVTSSGDDFDIIAVSTKKSGQLTLRSTATDGCNTSIKDYDFYAGILPPRLSVYPNPATDFITVEFLADKTDLSLISSQATEHYTIQLWHEQLGLLRSTESSESAKQVSLAGLPSGMYVVVLVRDGENIGRRIIWKK